jgi:photosystem II stability/assembly factor-like uncharacterized protein
MKKIFTYLILIFTLTFTGFGFIFSQTGWYQQQSETNKTLTSSSFINENTGWVAGYDGLILKTTNGGTKWIQQYSDTIHLLSVSFYNDKYGWAVGGKSHYTPLSDYVNIYLKTTNGGTSWQRVIGYSTIMVRQIRMLDSLIVIRIGGGGHFSGFISDGYIYRSSNNGGNWTDASYSNEILYYAFTSLFFLNVNTGWVVGLYGNDTGGFERIFLRTTNTGINWSYLKRDTVNLHQGYTNRLQFIDQSNGFLNYNPDIHKTNDGGSSWNEFTFGKDYYFYNLDTGWIINNSNQILRTNDGGNSWSLQNSPAVSIGSINFVNAETGWIVGNNGVILKTITGGITNIQQTSNLVPTEFSLHQNYPNPFNPVTNIKFSLPTTQYTILKVFDISGREVETLIDEVLQTGSYEFMFDASELSSGIYFYQLRVGDPSTGSGQSFVQTRKMVLTK